MAYGIDGDGYIVPIPETGSATITALDGSGDTFSPTLITRVDTEAESANQINTLINGEIAVTLVGDLPATGTLTMLFTTDSDMSAARSILGRPCAFSLVEPLRPVVNMTFVRQGPLTPGMHDEARTVWEFAAGFQQVIP